MTTTNQDFWIGVDLDGTLAHYDGWKGPEHIGEPVPVMLERVKQWLAEGKSVRIFTARVSARDEQVIINGVRSMSYVGFVRQVIERWCLKHIGQALPVTNVKDFGMTELWDDRAVQVEANTGRAVGYSTRGNT